jgi:hypothetical protein
MHSEGMPVRFPMYGEELPLPCRIEIFWSFVMRASTCDTRVAIGAVEPTQGQPVGGGDVVWPPPTVWTAISQRE